MPYLPGQAIILSRLPNQDWFTLDEAAGHAGWSRSYMRDRIKDGTLAAQEYQKPHAARAKGKGLHRTYRIHVDDLVLFIMRNGNGRFSEEKPFRDVAMIIRGWPAWMRRELAKHLARGLAPAVTSQESRVTGEETTVSSP